MRSGGSVLGVMAGVLPALGIVALTGSGFNPYGIQTALSRPSPNQATGTSTGFVATTSASEVAATASGSNMTNYLPCVTTERAALYSHLDSMTRQPITLTGFVLLPIFAALPFGSVLYRISRVRNELEEPQQAA